MLSEPALLDKCPAAAGYRANIARFPGMLLHMVEHRVLSFLYNTAVGTDKVSVRVADVGHR